MSESYIYENPTGSEGLFTFNFFCESVTGALHTLIHVMEDHELEAPNRLLSGLLKRSRIIIWSILKVLT